MQKNEVSLSVSKNDHQHNDLPTLSVPIRVPLGSRSTVTRNQKGRKKRVTKGERKGLKRMTIGFLQKCVLAQVWEDWFKLARMMGDWNAAPLLPSLSQTRPSACEWLLRQEVTS